MNATHQKLFALVLCALGVELAGADDLGLRLALLLGALQHPLLEQRVGHEGEHAHGTLLPDAMRTRLRLQVLLRVPGAAKEREGRERERGTGKN